MIFFEEFVEEVGPEALALLESAGAELEAGAARGVVVFEAGAGKVSDAISEGSAKLGDGIVVGLGATAAAAGVAARAIRDAFKGKPRTPVQSITQCPNPPTAPVEPVKPNITPRPVPRDPKIPDPTKGEEIARRKEDKQRRRCPELWDTVQKRTNRQRKKKSTGTQGMRYRYWDMICSTFDPKTAFGRSMWDSHRTAFESDQRGLQNDIDDFEQNCEGELPPGARDFAKEKFPDKNQWNGDSPACEKYRKSREERYDRYENDPNADNN
jgi:hypothetical protein